MSSGVPGAEDCPPIYLGASEKKSPGSEDVACIRRVSSRRGPHGLNASKPSILIDMGYQTRPASLDDGRKFLLIE